MNKNQKLVVALVFLTVFTVSFIEATSIIKAGNAYSQIAKLKTQFTAFLIGPSITLDEQPPSNSLVVDFLSGPSIILDESLTDDLVSLTPEFLTSDSFSTKQQDCSFDGTLSTFVSTTSEIIPDNPPPVPTSCRYIYM